MFQGFYNLASGMITQNRNLDVVSNNITNSLTPGYKKDTMTSSTFQEEMISRTGNLDKSSPQTLNNIAMIRTATGVVTDYSQGQLEETGNPLDMALTSDGFFQIQTQNGYVYTRNGSFIIDDEGDLALQSVGRVMGTNGAGIYLGTDDISVDASGNVRLANGNAAGTIAVVNFDDKTQLDKAENGVFTSNAQPTAYNGTILQKNIELSNVDSVQEMVNMMESQRALQSAAQVLKIYDDLMNKAVNNIGQV